MTPGPSDARHQKNPSALVPSLAGPRVHVLLPDLKVTFVKSTRCTNHIIQTPLHPSHSSAGLLPAVSFVASAQFSDLSCHDFLLSTRDFAQGLDPIQSASTVRSMARKGGRSFKISSIGGFSGSPALRRSRSCCFRRRLRSATIGSRSSSASSSSLSISSSSSILRSAKSDCTLLASDRVIRKHDAHLV